MPHNIILCRKQDEITDSAPSLYGTEAHKLTTCHNSIHTTHNFITQKISALIYLMCKSHFFLPHNIKTLPNSSTKFSYTFHIFLNLVNIPVPTFLSLLPIYTAQRTINFISLIYPVQSECSCAYTKIKQAFQYV
jgi:hypothetical protein